MASQINQIDTVRKFCSFCHSEGNWKICGKCRSVYYCSAEHQKEHWSVHKKLCKGPKIEKVFYTTSDNNLHAKEYKVHPKETATQRTKNKEQT